jgi:seryl-tRNA synthetase
MLDITTATATRRCSSLYGEQHEHDGHRTVAQVQEDIQLEGWDYWLVPTGGTGTNIHCNEILEEAELPKYYTAYTPCFRSEAGSHGKDTRGLIRQHQFNKVELVKLSKPEESYSELESLLENAETILRELGIHYRVIVLCTGDMGFSASKTYDIEVCPGQETYRDFSCSNFGIFSQGGQTSAPPQGEPSTWYTLNGSGLAVGRTLVALEVPAEDGRYYPRSLHPYVGKQRD